MHPADPLLQLPHWTLFLFSASMTTDVPADSVGSFRHSAIRFFANACALFLAWLFCCSFSYSSAYPRCVFKSMNCVLYFKAWGPHSVSLCCLQSLLLSKESSSFRAHRKPVTFHSSSSFHRCLPSPCLPIVPCLLRDGGKPEPGIVSSSCPGPAQFAHWLRVSLSTQAPLTTSHSASTREPSFPSPY